jgi:hypothetical protein
LSCGLHKQDLALGCLLFFSDISFHETIPQELELRVLYRKKLSSLIPRILFFFLFVIMTAGYIVAFFLYEGKNWKMFMAIIIILILTAALTYFLLYRMYEQIIAKRMDDNTKRKMRLLYQITTIHNMLQLRLMLYLSIGIAILLISAYSFFPISWLQYLG